MSAPPLCDIRPIDLKSDCQAISQLIDLLTSNVSPQPLDVILAEAIAGRFRLDGWFGAFRHRELLGIVCGQIQPGRCAAVWLPRLVPGQPHAIATALFEKLSIWLEATDVRIAQLLLQEPTPTDVALLESQQFNFLTDLLYLVCERANYPEAPPAAHLGFEAYSDANHARLLSVIEDTYRGTLDCPQLNGVRGTEDVLVGYRANGVFDPALWLLVTREGRDIGCLLLADYPSDENMELVYMGVTPAQRGGGMGVDIARHAGWIARQMGRRRLVVAVDAANQPALRMYVTAGFSALDARQVFLRTFERKND